jgi:RyR domain
MTENLQAIAFVARIAHEANRTYCVSIDDYSQPSWGAAPSWQTDSAIAGVKFVLANPDAGDDASHLNWTMHKIADGWTYGPVKDPETKTHPCLVPFEQLPPEQQAKDRLFRAVVLACAPVFGLAGAR